MKNYMVDLSKLVNREDKSDALPYKFSLHVQKKKSWENTVKPK